MSNADSIKIALMGPQRVGKTTYLGSIFHYFKDEDPKAGIKVTTIGSNALALQQNVQNTLVWGRPLAASTGVESYEFKIQYLNRFLGLKLPNEIFLRVGDYAGEIFQHLNVSPLPDKYKELIDEFIHHDKWMVLLNDWEPDADRVTSVRLEGLLNKLSPEQKKKVKVAVVMSKCERGELWPGKSEPELDIFSTHLRQTYRSLKNKFSESPNNLKFFASSAFGVIDPKIPLPNRHYLYEDGTLAIPRKTNDRNEHIWEPHGLLTPFAWLSSARGWKWNEH